MSVIKRVTALLLVLVLFVSLFPIDVFAASYDTVKVTGSTVNVRKGAGTSYSVIGAVKRNQTFTYLGSKKDSSGRTWYKIQYTSTKTAWITSQYSKLIKGTSSTTTTTTASASTTKVKITGNPVNIRSGAGMSYSIIGSVKKNQTFTYLGSKKASNGRVWYKIQYSSSKTGWVTSQFATLIKVSGTTIPVTTTTTTAVTTTTSAATTVTTQPTTQSTAAVSSTDATTITTVSTTVSSESTTVTTTTTTQPTTASTTVAVNPSYNYTLSKGSKGTKVKQLQNRLKTLGYISEAADGDFGNNTKKAVETFQRVANLTVNGIADPITLTVLYSSSAPYAQKTSNHVDVLNPDYEDNYYIIVYRDNCKVLVLGKDAYGKYNQTVKCFTCSVGATGHKTPTGVYAIDKRYRWRYLFNDVYGQYAVRFYGNYLFHSVPYLSQSASTLKTAEFAKLGSPASLGCVRLCVRDAKWIYDNASNGTQVRVLSGKNCSVQTEAIPALNTAAAYKGWDPTDPDVKNPYNK